MNRALWIYHTHTHRHKIASLGASDRLFNRPAIKCFGVFVVALFGSELGYV